MPANRAINLAESFDCGLELILDRFDQWASARELCLAVNPSHGDIPIASTDPG